MQILVITNMYPPHHLGGYELSCRDVVEGWRARGHRVTVLTSSLRIGGVPDPEGPDAAGVRRQLGIYWRDHRIWHPPMPARVATERANQRALRAALDDVEPDVVSVWNMGAMSFGLLSTLADRRLPTVFVVSDDWLIYGPQLDAWMRLFAGRPRLARLAGRVAGVPTAIPDLGAMGPFCFVSDTTRRRAEARSAWHPAEAGVVYCGIAPRDFPVADGPDDRPWRGRLLYVGRIDRRKGLATAVRALARLPEDTTLDVIGRGDDDHRRAVGELIAALGLDDRVRFSVAPRSELAGRYRAADAVVFPSEWEEPFGLVPLEAMACATPVVATGTGGSGEFLADQRNCLLFPPGDDSALAAAVRRLADDGGLRRRVVEGGLATAGVLRIDRLVDVLEAWHAATVSGARPPAPWRPPWAAAPSP